MWHDLLREAQSSFCQPDADFKVKLAIMYLAAMVAAMFHDHRILENLLWLKHDPFSFKRYGIPALVGIVFCTTFVAFAILDASLCPNANEGLDWTNPRIQ